MTVTHAKTLARIRSDAKTLARIRSDAYFVERMMHADVQRASVYRRTYKALKTYPSSIIFPETLSLLPCIGRSKRRQVWAVDFEVYIQGLYNQIDTRLRLLNYEGVEIAGTDRILNMHEVVSADMDGKPLMVAGYKNKKMKINHHTFQLAHYLPLALLNLDQDSFSLDALFSDKEDALRYQSDMTRYISGWKSQPDNNDWLPS
jgi:hypothetical protein